VKVFGVQIQYDESPLWIMSSITSMAPALDHLIVVDGGFALFPGSTEKPASRIECQEAVLEAAASVNLPLTYYKPNEPFVGNEVQKRQLSIDLALVHATPEDWLIIFDTDNTARYIAPDIKEILASENAQDHIVATYAVCSSFDAQIMTDEHGWNPHTNFGPMENADPVRAVYRALPGLRYGPAHYYVSAPLDGELVWLFGDPGRTKPYADALDLTSVLKVNHRRAYRVEDRARRAREYYALRDGTGVEQVTQVWVEGLDGKPCPV
jgi:hypothetical protein